jgi:hypothetical protein
MVEEEVIMAAEEEVVELMVQVQEVLANWAVQE